ncbi:putative venom acid phosphatase, partial [Operophtera brumata]
MIPGSTTHRPDHHKQRGIHCNCRKEGGREEEPTDAPEAAAPGMRIEHTCCCLGVLVGISLIAENSIVIASDTELSKMTALLISAGLWPPPEEQMWNETILWQPVSYTYPPRNQDYLLYEENCPRYLQEKQRILDAFTEEVEGPNLRVIVRTGTPENVAALLAACVAPPPRLPDPGAALLFELHERLPQPHQKNKKAVLEKARFGLKVPGCDSPFCPIDTFKELTKYTISHNYKEDSEPRLMEVPGCDSPFCPIDTFKELTKYTISHNYKED